MASKNPSGKGGFKDHPENRNQHGQRNKAAVSFSRSLRELIVAEGNKTLTLDGKKHRKVELLIRKLWTEALSGKEWAATMIFERTEGKVKDELDVMAKGSIDVFNHDVIATLISAGRPSGDNRKSGED